MKNQLVIFSKNRACQLHLLLESIEKNSDNLFDIITIIYKYTNKSYDDGYKIVKKSFPNINFINENDFYEDTIKSIDKNIEFTTFMVDDNLFYQKLGIKKEQIFSLFFDSDTPISCFSLRLGLNCVYSHPANLNYKIGNYEEVSNLIKINIWEQRGDFAYPLSVDGHIFRTIDILTIFNMVGRFNNPNTFETILQSVKPKIQKYMAFPKESVLVGVPVNIVNDTHKNRSGLTFYFSEKELNFNYINNKKVDINQLDLTNINGPHKEIEYKFNEN